MEWNDETIVRLRTFWNEGLSTAEIGRRIGVSKNAVVGKAHRLGLSARPSPIRRGGLGGGGTARRRRAGPAGAAAAVPGRRLLLAARGAGNPQFPLLRCGGAGR